MPKVDDDDDDDILNEFTDVSQSTVVEETTSSIKESAALLKQKRFQNKSCCEGLPPCPRRRQTTPWRASSRRSPQKARKARCLPISTCSALGATL